jgi:hypothetical protein
MRREKQLTFTKLLLPAVRVNCGFVEHRKTDGHTYYEYGAICWGTKHWLDKYQKRELVEHPAETEFREWSTYKGVWPQKSHYFAEIPLPRYEMFYSKYQMFPLKAIQDGLRVVLKDQALFVDDQDWLDVGKIRRMFVPAPEFLQKRVLRYYQTFGLLHNILNLLAIRKCQANRAYKVTLRDYQRSELSEETEVEQPASEAAWDSIDEQDRLEMPRKARVILDKSGLSPKEIEKWREEFSYLGFIVDPMHGWSVRFNSAIRETLEASSSEFKFAGECYVIAEQLGWFLRMVGERPPSLEKMQSGIDGLRACVICQRPFTPKRKSDVTCGDKECIAAHRKDLRAEWKRKRRKKV